MDIDSYKPMFEQVCDNLELPSDKVRAFAFALSGMHPEFRHVNSTTRSAIRVGLLAVPVERAEFMGVGALELERVEKNILIGCEILRKIYDDIAPVYGDKNWRWHATCNRYVSLWDDIKDKWESRYHTALKRIRAAEKPEEEIEQ